TSPAARLDINGNIRIRGGNPVAGHVLTATDALGNAEWKAPAGGAVQKVLNISFADFFPQNSFIGYSSIAAIGRYPATAATGAVTFEAPLNLPVGTKLISIQWLFFDLSAKDFSFCVAYDDNYTNDATNSKVFVGGCASSSGMSNLPQVLNKSLQNHIMLNTPYSLQVTVTDWPNTHLIHLKGARIIYE
ncbi:MAG TPA: hypothetical protein PKD90_11470, partial [Phnomibacter sp.]|nr:hypothetical protein [Phnomibacter sp.]